MTFDWVRPLVKKGRDATLNEDDVWNISFTIRSKPLFTKFNESKCVFLARVLCSRSKTL
jgi:hypothetical protein